MATMTSPEPSSPSLELEPPPLVLLFELPLAVLLPLLLPLLFPLPLPELPVSAPTVLDTVCAAVLAAVSAERTATAPTSLASGARTARSWFGIGTAASVVGDIAGLYGFTLLQLLEGR
ncbi:MAG TPA: hypothetical protein VEI82_01855 [Myxococcota bacterium]|nr:hypothetical protein [Myxococcota bacterium]